MITINDMITIKITNDITLKIGDTTYPLTREEAELLYNQLGVILNKTDKVLPHTPTYPTYPMYPTYPGTWWNSITTTTF